MHEVIAMWLCPALVQWRRRAALLLATWGVDVGARRIHGVKIGAGPLAVAR
ncbi:hypothetical protein [Streptacidiphilus sp. MAP5-3]|uniref:hypothetical protein n=1 Tax=unclassified Streptacidiphilus TaxID=2643834 RepID=UPI003514F2C5